uniref:Uncharacterized protein n=1 Tax=Timema genevievae TaxID=629358 RepID=A0A7R9JZ66_TIMGE|nr:unnamed protein product [Timema genevievae]
MLSCGQCSDNNGITRLTQHLLGLSRVTLLSSSTLPHSLSGDSPLLPSSTLPHSSLSGASPTPTLLDTSSLLVRRLSSPPQHFLTPYQAPLLSYTLQHFLIPPYRVPFLSSPPRHFLTTPYQEPLLSSSTLPHSLSGAFPLLLNTSSLLTLFIPFPFSTPLPRKNPKANLLVHGTNTASASDVVLLANIRVEFLYLSLSMVVTGKEKCDVEKKIRRPLPNVTVDESYGGGGEMSGCHGCMRSEEQLFLSHKSHQTWDNKVVAFGAETWFGAGFLAPNMVSALDQTIRESLDGETGTALFRSANWRVPLVVLVAVVVVVVVVDAGDMMRKSIVFDKKTPEVFYCPQHKPTGFDKLLVRARPLSKLCQFGGQPLPEDYKSDCYNDVDESEYACKEKYRIMKRLVQKKDNQFAGESTATTEVFPTEDY